MRLFGRKPAQAAEPERIAGFWRWWAADGEQAATKALDDSERTALVPVLADRVNALDPGLSWEVGPHPFGGHLLVVSSGGSPGLRALARRWLLAAPEPVEGASWAFSDQRPPVESPTDTVLSTDAGEIALADVVVGARQSGARFDVTLFHPAFAELHPDARLQIAFHTLDTALGELGTELWVGEVETATLSPRDGFGVEGLRIAVKNLEKEYVDPDGNPAWVLLHGEGPTGPVIASAIVPLHPVTAPNLTHHVSLRVPYAGFAERGLPDVDALAELRDLEDALGGLLGSDGRIVAHETTNGVRVLHAYVDPTSDGTARLRAAASQWAHGSVVVRVDPDPAWDAVRPLRA